jgi:hypothetical protein
VLRDSFEAFWLSYADHEVGSHDPSTWRALRADFVRAGMRLPRTRRLACGAPPPRVGFRSRCSSRKRGAEPAFFRQVRGGAATLHVQPSAVDRFYRSP